MEEFQKELSALLEKYPTLPKFTLTVQPRFVISTEPEVKKYVPPVPKPVTPGKEVVLEDGEIM